MYKYRVNTNSLELAVRIKKLLEARSKGEYDVGVSSKNMIFLDYDNKDDMDRFVKFCAGICEEYASEGVVIETDNGLHFILLKLIPRTEWYRFYNALRYMAERDNLPVDLNYVKAVINRGYATLRMTTAKKIVARIKSNGEVVWQEEEKEG